MNADRDESSIDPEPARCKQAGNLTDQARSDRAREVQMEVASARRQGLEPIPEFFGIAERYIAGEFTLDQFSAAVHQLCPPV